METIRSREVPFHGLGLKLAGHTLLASTGRSIEHTKPGIGSNPTSARGFYGPAVGEQVDGCSRANELYGNGEGEKVSSAEFFVHWR